MTNSNEEKILQLLRKRVLEKDEELSQKEYLSATKEALVDMTKLSSKEVNDIYLQIKKEMAEKQKKRNKIILYVSIAALVLVYLNYSWVLNMIRKPEKYTDDFSKNTGSWSFINELKTSYFIEKGTFIMDSHEDSEGVSFVTKEIIFPKNYSIEIDAIKLNGVKDNYGIYLNQSEGNFLYFFINNSGKFKTGCALNSKWQKVMVNKDASSIHKSENKINNIKIEVLGDNFKFLVNNIIVNEGSMNKILASSFSLAVSNTQKISYDNLIIKDLDKKTVLYQSTFDKEEAPWANLKEVLRNSEYKNGAYHLTVNVDDYCYWAWSMIPYNFDNLNKFELRVDAQVQSVEDAYNFGIMLINDDKNYFTFNVESEFGARYMISYKSDYAKTGNYNNNLLNKSGKYKLKLAVLKDKIEFYVNDIFVDKIDKKRNYLYWPEIEKIGLRVCNHNTVAFDNFQLKEIK
jgi:hypothetical protein